MKFVSLLITVSDVARSRTFYEQVLEQEVEIDFGRNVSFKGGFAIHQRDHFKELIDNREIRPGSNDFELYFEYDDVKGFVNKLTEHNVRLVHPLKEQPWRQFVVRFYDPDDHIIEVGETMAFLCSRLHKEGLSVEEIAKATGLPDDFIKMSLIKEVQEKIINMEKAALVRWGNGDPSGFLEISADDVVYFDVGTEQRLDGHQALTALYESFRGKVSTDSFEMINPKVQYGNDMAVLTFNLISYSKGNAHRWNCTEVYRLEKQNEWKIIQTHWSLTKPALQTQE